MDPDQLPPLPSGSVLLHIGHPKTGSTSLQRALAQRRLELPEHGACYPGVGLRAREGGWAALGIGAAIGRPPPRMAAWEGLCAEVAAAAELRVCLSTEDFARARGDAVQRIVADLGGDRVHVLLVIRRLDRLLPSQWQERVKAAERIDYEAWLRRALGGDAGGQVARRFPWLLDLEGLVTGWTKVVGAERFTLVVGDETDHTQVPRTVERLLALPSGMLTASLKDRNRSLGRAETELLLAVNRVFHEHRLAGSDYHRLVQQGMLRSLIRVPRSPDDPPYDGLPVWARERVAHLGRERAALVRSLGVRVVGDPDDLLAPTSSPEADLEPPDRISVEVAARAVAGVLAALPRRDRHDPDRRPDRRRGAGAPPPRPVSRLRRLAGAAARVIPGGPRPS